MKTLKGLNSNRKIHPGGWPVFFTRIGVLRPRWYQGIIEAWLILSGRWTLHRAWQAGFDAGTRAEYERVVENWGDLGPLFGMVIDATAGRELSTAEKTKILAQVARREYKRRGEYWSCDTPRNGLSTPASGTQ